MPVEYAKFIVTNKGALKAKYGAGLSRVLKAVDGLVAADAARGIVSRLVALDVAADMAPYGGRPMDGPKDREGAKRCIDAIDKVAEPHYLLILGGPDVVPMQWLFNTAGMLAGTNPEQWKLGDDDRNVPSDLPYACDAAFSDDAGEFQGPTRVVGRLPDVPGARNPDFLVKVLKLAAAAKPLPREAYAKWMAVSTETWERSTRKTVTRIFGDDTRMIISPPRKNPLSPRTLAPRVHFYNCHGGPSRIGFVGERADHRQCDVITAPKLRGKVTAGTVVVAECCFGADVFDPKDGEDAPGTLGMALEYLRQGAYGFFGSSTTAYGQTSTNDYADVICRNFTKKVLAGASLGRAALEARIDYLKYRTWDDPVKLKTLAQFHLLGDPSIHPVAAGRPAVEGAVRLPAALLAQLGRQRAKRRKKQREEGRRLYTVRRRFKYLGLDISSDIVHKLEAMASELAMRGKLLRFFEMSADVEEAARGGASRRAKRSADQVVLMLDKIAQDIGDEPAPDPGLLRPVPCYGGLVAYIQDGKIVRIKKIVSR